MGDIGFIGLGKMGKRMAARAVSKGFTVVGYDIDKKARFAAASCGIKTVEALEALVTELERPRKIVLMLPAGTSIDNIISSIQLDRDDIVVDAGNSYYKDSRRRSQKLKDRGIFFLDIGTSGGLKGAVEGASIVIGGDKAAYETMLPFLNAFSTKDGVLYVGESGSGHYVKMVHNAIEYGMLQAYAEGFELLKSAPYDLDLAKISRVWNNGSVIRSWILDLIEDILEKGEDLSEINGCIGGGETGRWAIEEAWDRQVPFQLISTALNLRFLSRGKESFSSKLIAAMRKEFGGHDENL